MRFFRPFLLAALCLASVGMGSSPLLAADKATSGAAKAIDFTLKDLNGKTHSLKDEKGKVVVVNFWATWCGPCRIELPHLNDVYNKLKGGPLTVFGVSVDNDQTVGSVRSVVASQGFKFNVLLDTDNNVVGKYNPEGIIPFTVIIDYKGNVQHVHKGYNPGDERIVEQELRDLIKAAQNDQSTAKKSARKK